MGGRLLFGRRGAGFDGGFGDVQICNSFVDFPDKSGFALWGGVAVSRRLIGQQVQTVLISSK